MCAVLAKNSKCAVAATQLCIVPTNAKSTIGQPTSSYVMEPNENLEMMMAWKMKTNGVATLLRKTGI